MSDEEHTPLDATQVRYTEQIELAKSGFIEKYGEALYEALGELWLCEDEDGSDLGST